MSWVEFIIPIGLALITEELLGWMEQLAKWLVRHNARQAPENLAARLEEEWSACLANTPGKISKLLFAADCRRAAYIMSHQARMPHISPLVPLLVRIFDLVASLSLLFFTAPTMVVVVIAIRLCDRGPIFYLQERVGLNGHLFLIRKFRTTNGEGRTLTLVGRMLRRVHMDELPILLNVVRGEMSFVGPRPERPQYVKAVSALIPDYDLRHKVRPGITGLAQVSSYYAGFSRRPSTRENLEYDLLFIKNYSVTIAIHLIFKTCRIGYAAKSKSTTHTKR